MTAVSVAAWLSMIMSTFILFIGGVSFKHYRRTGVQDFLLWAGFFYTLSLARYCYALSLITNNFFFIQCYFWVLCSSWFLPFLFAIRMRWEHAPPIVWYLGVTWFGILIFLITFLEPMQEPTRAIVLFWELPRGYSEFYPDGAGIMTSGGTILFSTAHNLLHTGYMLYVVGLWVYTHLVTPLSYSSDRSILAKRLWITTGFLVIIGLVWWLPGFSLFWGLTDVLFVVAVGFVTYISIWLPEGLLLSQVQLARAVELYEQIQRLTTKEAIKRFGMPSLVEYLQAIPPELLTQTKE